MQDSRNLQRFIDAQQADFQHALSEMKQGRKQSHWMWYIFPQIVGLGKSTTSLFYGIKDMQEARDYLEHPLLSNRLLTISRAILSVNGKTAYQILGSPDNLKLQSSMTLFSSVPGADPVFQEVLDKYFSGEKDIKTVHLIKGI